jgi:hypothetical protein
MSRSSCRVHGSRASARARSFRVLWLQSIGNARQEPLGLIVRSRKLVGQAVVE